MPMPTTSRSSYLQFVAGIHLPLRSKTENETSDSTGGGNDGGDEMRTYSRHPRH